MAGRAGASRTVHRPHRRWPAGRCSGPRSPEWRRPGWPACWRRAAAARARARPSAGETIPAPDNPVRWPLSEANPMIESGLTPERGSTLRIYNYADYLSPRVLKDFEEHVRRRRSGLDVQRRRRGADQDRLRGPRLRRLLPELRLPRPAGRRPTCCGRSTTTTSPTSATSGRSSATRGTTTAARYTDPVHDLHHRHRLAHRHGRRRTSPAMNNPYDVFWDTEYAGNMAVIDDWHTAMAMVLLRNGIYDINTTDPKDIALVRDQLLEMRAHHEAAGHDHDVHRPAGRPVRPVPDVVGRRGQPALLPAEQGLRRRAALLVPRGRPGRGRQRPHGGASPRARTRWPRTSSSTTCSTTRSPRPNFGYIGYQPPLIQFTPDRLVADGYVPENLATAMVLQKDFDVGVPLLQLPAAADTAYHQVWQEFKAGG